MPTVISNPNPYCTAAEMVERCDVRTLGDWLSDTGTRLDSGSVLASTILANLLKQASGLIESAVLRGNRYRVTDLTALTGNSAQLLKGLTADLTLYLVWSRRPDRTVELPARARVALELLDKIDAGERIFGLQEQADAGNVSSTQEVQQDVDNRNLATTVADRYFGRHGTGVKNF